jgi:hypothetical protein
VENNKSRREADETAMKTSRRCRKIPVTRRDDFLWTATSKIQSRQYSDEEGVAKETPGSPTSNASGQCKRIDEEDAKYIVPKMDITYSLKEEEDKKDVSNVMPSPGTIHKSNRTKHPPSVKLDNFLWSI